MNESITKRVKRIISGGVNAMVKAVEDKMPEAVMEEAISEVDAAREEVRVELGKVIANKHLCQKQLNNKNEVLERLTGQIQLALSAGKEDLAKSAVSQQIDIEAQIPVLKKTIDEYMENEQELERYLGALAAKIREMKAELLAFRAQQKQTISDASHPHQASKIQQTSERAHAAFHSVLERHSGLGLQAGFDLSEQANLLELEQLSHAHRVEERLQAIKALSKAEAKE